MGVKKMVIKYVVKKAFVLLLVAFIFMTHLSLCVSADNAYGSSEKLDYAGLLTRMDKYQKYSGYGKLFDHSTKIMLSGYGYDACGGFLKYSDVSDLDWESLEHVYIVRFDKDTNGNVVRKVIEIKKDLVQF